MERIFDEYYTDIVVTKLSPGANSQRNEALNSVKGSKNPKIRYYVASASNYFQVACGISQVNLDLSVYIMLSFIIIEFLGINFLNLSLYNL